MYNAAPYLSSCIESIRRQSYTNWEIVSFNDGSTDSSLEILESYEDPRMRIYSDTVNRGAGWCRNFLISQARGSLLALQDSDDLMSEDRLQLQVELLENKPHLDVIGSYMTLISDEGKVVENQLVKRTNFTLLRALFKSEFPPHASIMARKTWFQRNPYPIDIDRAEDKFLIARAIKCLDFSVEVIPKSLYFYRYNASLDKDKKLASYRAERSHLIYLLDSVSLRTLFLLFSYLKSALVNLTRHRWG